MLSLEYEIGIFLTISAIIGVLMGRFLCKSGETEERIKKEKFIKSFKSSQLELKKSETMLQNFKIDIKDSQEKIAILEQEITNLNTKLSSSDTQRMKILDDLRELEKYETRFKALNSEFELQSNLIKELQKDKSFYIQKLESSDTFTKILKEKLSQTKEKSDKIIIINNKQTKELKDLNDTYKNNITLKEKLEKLEKMFNIRNSEYDKIYSKYNDYKTLIIKDDKRLIFLEKEYLEATQLLDITLIQRDDLLSRIRAISSVVNAVGVENE